MDFGLLIIRLVAGALLVGHGTQKLFGWFGGYGPVGTGQYFASLGYRGGAPLAVAAGLGEAGGGLLLALGFFTPLGAAAVIGVMANAIVAQHRGKGPWVANGGWELPLLYSGVAALLAFAGPGVWSVDEAIGFELEGLLWGFVALVIGLGTALAALFTRTEPFAGEDAPAAEMPSSERQAA
ncbi:MAG TPA: DoxX family protein [Acidimicrobiia bacterium]|nr:DoxX family protein [Acidimicrobiia bacterium]